VPKELTRELKGIQVSKDHKDQQVLKVLYKGLKDQQELKGLRDLKEHKVQVQVLKETQDFKVRLVGQEPLQQHKGHKVL
jgi:hypothetical protein